MAAVGFLYVWNLGTYGRFFVTVKNKLLDLFVKFEQLNSFMINSRNTRGLFSFFFKKKVRYRHKKSQTHIKSYQKMCDDYYILYTIIVYYVYYIYICTALSTGH